MKGIGGLIRVALLVAVMFPFTVYSQEKLPLTVHVLSAGVESQNEVSPGLMRGIAGADLVYTVYTVESGEFTYALESADTRQPEVGKDYEVSKISRSHMVLLIPGKKHPAEVDFYIKSVSEKTKDA
jgi:hypothetical protein